MFKNAQLYRIAHWDAALLADIETRLAAAQFVECGATQQESAGWVAPRGEQHGAMLESVAGQWILRLCTETRAVPSSVVKTQLAAQLDRIETDTGRRPKGRAAREMKDAIVHTLLPRAFPKRADTPVWIDTAAGTVLVGSASAKKADKVLTLLVELLGGALALRPLQTNTAPATAMAAWLSDKAAPAGFSIDRDCELKQPDGEKAAVRYGRHTLDIDEVGEHIRQGKQPTQLALTWGGRVSFVLSDALALKKIRLTDDLLDKPGSAAPADKGFDADVAIITGELRRLIPDLVDALGGELALDAAAPSAAPQPLPAARPAAGGVAPWEDAVAA